MSDKAFEEIAAFTRGRLSKIIGKPVEDRFFDPIQEQAVKLLHQDPPQYVLYESLVKEAYVESWITILIFRKGWMFTYDIDGEIYRKTVKIETLEQE